MVADVGNPWNNLTAQQLIRYEALFRLIEDIQNSEDLNYIAKQVAIRWKYFARVTSWHLVVFQDCQHVVIDGNQGEARTSVETSLSSWDSHYHNLGVPSCVNIKGDRIGPPAPDHMRSPDISDIRVFPISRSESCIALLSVAARDHTFNDLDLKFIQLVGRYLADRVSDIIRFQRERKALTEKATRDALTGVYNRGFILENLQKQILLPKRTNNSLGLLLIDIDHFKKINDAFGHQVGDMVLQEITKRLQQTMRDSDSLGRYGGEEFLFVLFPCDVQMLASVAERVRDTIASRPIILQWNRRQQIEVTISLGGTSATPQSDVSCNTLIKIADEALYRSKANGRNCVTII